MLSVTRYCCTGQQRAHTICFQTLLTYWNRWKKRHHVQLGNSEVEEIE